MTAPFGARLPRRITMPPSACSGSSRVRITSSIVARAAPATFSDDGVVPDRQRIAVEQGAELAA